MPSAASLTPRLLTTTDADISAYVALRREMLLDSPPAFGASPEDDIAADPAALAARLKETENAIAVIDHPHHTGRLIASAGVVRAQQRKARHRAVIWGVYVTPDFRARACGRAVMRLALETARSWPGVEVAHLSAGEGSHEAIALYRRLGFEQWGTEPDAIRIDGRSFTEIHMQLRL